MPLGQRFFKMKSPEFTNKEVVMLTLNDIDLTTALTKAGLAGKSSYPYKELLTSEISYCNHFLFFLNEDDFKALLKVYDGRYFHLQKGEMTQAQLRAIFEALKELREHQQSFLKELYEPDPQRWLQCLFDLNVYYQAYFKLSLSLVVPSKVDLKFREIQATKMKAHYPQVGALCSVLIAPIQRLPRYLLLGRELLKAVDKQQAEVPSTQTEAPLTCDKLLAFKQALVVYLKGISFLTQEINTMMEEPLDLPEEEPSSPYLQPLKRKRAL